MLTRHHPAHTPPTPRQPRADFAPYRQNLHTFATDGVRVAGSATQAHIIETMDKRKAELITILWTVVKVAIGYLIGYVTNNPEAADQVLAFLNY